MPLIGGRNSIHRQQSRGRPSWSKLIRHESFADRDESPNRSSFDPMSGSSTSDVYISHVAPSSGAVGGNSNKPSNGIKRGFLWDTISPKAEQPVDGASLTKEGMMMLLPMNDLIPLFRNKT
ncbi:hypothetical protein POM88_027935 [Heracleum sosnowskyi]|uniref:Uncharacterized protein n=1 Tax=Heracleum sosnowskyi TaxID=360622 RepID=A0AAD8I9X5_9APIA|nr:hypothetical protein POM88_027935 [Heracleum sosnowskyi]